MSQCNIMTVDVEDWYHSSLDLFKDTSVQHGSRPDPSVVDNTLRSLELLNDSGNRATFFILGTVAEHYPDVVREIQRQGHEVATHGYAHDLVYNLTPRQFEDDLRRSLDLLDRAGASNVLGYRAPYWSITRRSLWALEVLQKLGFRYDSSIFPIRRGLYGIPNAVPYAHETRTGFWEFPPATVRRFGLNWPIAGGGYLRLAPYRTIASAIQASQRQHVFYFHPYELDPNDVHLKHEVRSIGTLLYWFQQKIGRRSNPEKLRRLLYDFKFVAIRDVLLDSVGS